MTKVDDHICCVCASPIVEIYKYKKDKEKHGHNVIKFRKMNDKVVQLGPGLLRHSKCDPNSTNWMKNPELKKISDEAMEVVK